MSVDCIQMSARVGFALRSLVPPINGDHYAIDCVLHGLTRFFTMGGQETTKHSMSKQVLRSRLLLLIARLPRANEVS